MNRYIIVAAYYFTKWVEIFSLPDQTASTCARVLLNEVFARYGICSTLHSDQGRNFQDQNVRNKKRLELQLEIQDVMVKLRDLIGLLLG